MSEPSAAEKAGDYARWMRERRRAKTLARLRARKIQNKHAHTAVARQVAATEPVVAQGKGVRAKSVV